MVVAVTDLDALRAIYARLVTSRCAYDTEFAHQFDVFDGEGRRVIVPLLEDDTVEMASRLVAQAGGKAALSVLRTSALSKAARKSQKIAVMTTARLTVISAESDDEACHVPVTDGCTLRDLFRVVMPGSSITMTMTFAMGDEVSIAGVGTSEVPDENKDLAAF